MQILNIDYVPGQRVVESLGLVRGNAARGNQMATDLIAGLRGMMGGDMQDFENTLEEARAQALKRMRKEARKLGADAVISVRFGDSGLLPFAAEVLCYGTAVVLEPEN